MRASGPVHCEVRRRYSLKNLVGLQQYRLRDRQAKGLGGLEVDSQLELRRPLHGQIGRLRASEDLVHMGNTTAEQVGNARPIGDETAELHKLSRLIHRREPVPRGQVDDASALIEEYRAGKYEDGFGALYGHC